MAMGRSARHGIFIKGQDGVERLASVDHVILDKTGTLTQGKLTLAEQYFLSALSPDDTRRKFCPLWRRWSGFRAM